MFKNKSGQKLRHDNLKDNGRLEQEKDLKCNYKPFPETMDMSIRKTLMLSLCARN